MLTLKQKTISSIRWTTTAGVIQGTLRIAQIAVLARLLSPEDFGLMAIVAVVVSFAELLSDMGINSAFLQRTNVTQEQRSSLFWLNLLISFGITVVVISISPLGAGFFNDERLTSLIMLSSSIFILGALSAQIKIARQKELDFRPLVLLELSIAIIGFLTAVLAALAGLGVYALVLSSIIGSLAGTMLAWIFLAQGWRPMWRLKMDDVRPFLGFGGSLVASNFINQTINSIDLFFGGRMLMIAQLGLYSIPRNLTLQIQLVVNPIITRVGFPLIAKLQHDVIRVKSVYLKTLNMTASTNAPIYLAVAFYAPEVIAVLLGSKWSSSGDLLRLLALWGGLRSLGNPVGILVLGMGRADLSLKWVCGVLLLMIPVLWFGAQFGAYGLAFSMFCIQCVLFIPAWYILVRPLCHAGFIEYATSGFKPFLLVMIAFSPAYWLSMHIDISVLRLSVGVTVGMSFYLLASYKFNREWTDAMLELLGKRSATKLDIG